MGQQLAQALGPARVLIDRISHDPDAAIEELRRWYYHQHPAERDRLLWQRFTEAEQIYGRLEDEIRAARAALEFERVALVQVEDGAAEACIEPVRRYQALGLERDARQTAIADLERMLRAPEQTIGQLTEAIGRVLEAVITIEREAVVRRLRESGELEHLRSRFERLRLMANTHAAEIDDWSQRASRPVRVPRVMFFWPSAAIWDALLAEAVEPAQLVCDDDPNRPGG